MYIFSEITYKTMKTYPNTNPLVAFHGKKKQEIILTFSWFPLLLQFLEASLSSVAQGLEYYQNSLKST